MKIENYQRVQLLVRRIKQNEISIKTIEDILSARKGNGDGTDTSRDKKLYSLHLNEYGDGSGFNVDLSGSMVQTEVLEFIREKLADQIIADGKELENL